MAPDIIKGTFGDYWYEILWRNAMSILRLASFSSAESTWQADDLFGVRKEFRDHQ
jgi:hypothetical protein